MKKRATYSPPHADLFCVRTERGFAASDWYKNEIYNGGQIDLSYGEDEDTWG